MGVITVPDSASAQFQVTVTFVLFQPLVFGFVRLTRVIVGAVVSIMMVTGSKVEAPAPFVALHSNNVLDDDAGGKALRAMLTGPCESTEKEASVSCSEIAEDSRAEDSKAEDSRAEDSNAEDSRAEPEIWKFPVEFSLPAASPRPMKI